MGGETPTSHGEVVFYCCQCGFGPMNTELYGACITCGHFRDAYCSTAEITIEGCAHQGNPSGTYGSQLM